MTKQTKEMKKKKFKLKSMAKALRKHPLAAWSTLFCIWLVDLGSTAIALEVLPATTGLREGNPLAAWFFSQGLIGWFLWAVIVGLTLLFLIKLPTMFKKFSVFDQILVFAAPIITESVVIINNFSLIISRLL